MAYGIMHTLGNALVYILLIASITAHVICTGDLIIAITGPIHGNSSECDITMVDSMYKYSLDGVDVNWIVGNDCGIEYLPTIELSVKTVSGPIDASSIVLILAITSVLVYISKKYVTCTIAYASSFAHESIACASTESLLSVLCSLAYTDWIWSSVYLYVPMHSFNEYGVYEFDSDIDVQRYMLGYICAIMTHHIIFMRLTHTSVYGIILVALIANAIGIYEICYFVALLGVHAFWHVTFASILETLYN